MLPTNLRASSSAGDGPEGAAAANKKNSFFKVY